MLTINANKYFLVLIIFCNFTIFGMGEKLELEQDQKCAVIILNKIKEIQYAKRSYCFSMINYKAIGYRLREDIENLNSTYNGIREILGESEDHSIDWQWLKDTEKKYVDFLSKHKLLRKIQTIFKMKNRLEDFYVVEKIERVAALINARSYMIEKYNKIRKYYKKEEEININCIWLWRKKRQCINFLHKHRHLVDIANSKTKVQKNNMLKLSNT